MSAILFYVDSVSPWVVGAILNLMLLGVAWRIPKKLLTPAGYIHAFILGVLVWGCLGGRGYAVVMLYFLVGSAVTRIGLKEKEAAGIAEQRSGVRGPANVWGSALTATVCALGVFFAHLGESPWVGLSDLLTLGYVASFATKLSDTTASEVGKVYGRRTFLITTFQPVPRGTEGAVSLEGTLAGIGGSLLIAIAAWGLALINGSGIVICALAAFVATNIESIIGATWQEEVAWLTNERVNIINTTVGALGAIALGRLL